ncbi:hypothetical protein B6U98_00020 [Thermoplasmatales archaeon ex4572_165]|nr:MAG: hypothetical protein B6U98_00020 [Thermoplasmatales archaeon ex4572_165]RLF57661.1 MAG: hypothetical protein DRN27_07350 [Thermoplasmata archaeon]
MSSKPSNYQITHAFLQNLLYRIQRRTDEDFAIDVIDTVVKKLKTKNDFFQYIHIIDNRSNDDFNHLQIDTEINSIPSDQCYKSINQLFISSIKTLGDVANFFFIREFKKSLGAVIVRDLSEGGINLDLLQSSYILEQQEMYHVDNTDLIEDVLITLVKILNTKYENSETIEILFSIVSAVERRYPFLKYVKISKLTNSKESLEIRVYPDINEVWSLKIGESIQSLLRKTKQTMQYKTENTYFEKSFKQRIGRSQLTILDRIGVNFDSLKHITEHSSQKELTEKILQSIIQFIGHRTSVGFAVSLIDDIINFQKEKHEILKTILINKNQYCKGMDAIIVDEQINDYKPYELGKALRDIIRNAGKDLNIEHKMKYINEIKRYLGKEILKEFDTLGINLHVIELQLKV